MEILNGDMLGPIEEHRRPGRADVTDDQDRLEAHLAETQAIQDEVALALGRFLMRFGMLEAHLAWGVGCLLGVTDGQAKVLGTVVWSVTNRLETFDQLVRAARIKPATRRALAAVSQEISRLNTVRNTLVHNQWGATDPTARALQKIWLKPARSRKRWAFATFTAASIEEESKALLRCASDLGEAVKAFQDERPTSSII